MIIFSFVSSTYLGGWYISGTVLQHGSNIETCSAFKENIHNVEPTINPVYIDKCSTP